MVLRFDDIVKSRKQNPRERGIGQRGLATLEDIGAAITFYQCFAIFVQMSGIIPGGGSCVYAHAAQPVQRADRFSCRRRTHASPGHADHSCNDRFAQCVLLIVDRRINPAHGMIPKLVRKHR